MVMIEEPMRFTVGKDLFPPTGGSTCDACGEPLVEGQRVFMSSHLATPWLPEDSEDHEWSGYCWHGHCDKREMCHV